MNKFVYFYMNIVRKIICHSISSHKSLFILSILFSFILSQNTITGSVRDNNGEILPGANVFIKSIGIGAIVDFDGNFELEDVPNGTHSLTISLISYKEATKEIIINNNDIDNISINLELAPITKTKIVVEGKQTKKSTVKPICKIRFNNILQSFRIPIVDLPPEYNVDDEIGYNKILHSTSPILLLGASKTFSNGIESGFITSGDEFRIFIQSSIMKIEIGKISSSPIFSVGIIYETKNRLNVEFDINYYDIIRKDNLLSTTNMFITENFTSSISLSINFD